MLQFSLKIFSPLNTSPCVSGKLDPSTSIVIISLLTTIEFKKKLNIIVEENIVYVSDNLGFLYAYDYENNKMMHYHRKNFYHDSYRIPGTAAYAVTVQGATKLLASLKKNGWEQSDYFVNNKNVRLQAFGPEFFTFKMPNLNMSHGKHL